MFLIIILIVIHNKLHVSGVSQVSSNSSAPSSQPRTSPELKPTKPSLNDAVKRQLSKDIKQRGPPPQPPSVLPKTVSVRLMLNVITLIIIVNYLGDC